MNPLSLINSEFTAATGIAMTPDIFANLPATFPPHLQEEQPRILDHYGIQSIQAGDDGGGRGGGVEAGRFAGQFVSAAHEDNSTDNAAYDDNDGRSSTPAESFEEGHSDQRHSIGNGGNVDDDQMHGSDSSNSLDDDMLSAEHGDGEPFEQRSRSTQTNRKIKPVKRPGLVLRTPIAYQPCSDLSVIPIQRDGMGTFVLLYNFLLCNNFDVLFLFCVRLRSVRVCMCVCPLPYSLSASLALSADRTTHLSLVLSSHSVLLFVHCFIRPYTMCSC